MIFLQCINKHNDFYFPTKAERQGYEYVMLLTLLLISLVIKKVL